MNNSIAKQKHRRDHLANQATYIQISKFLQVFNGIIQIKTKEIVHATKKIAESTDLKISLSRILAFQFHIHMMFLGQRCFWLITNVAIKITIQPNSCKNMQPASLPTGLPLPERPLLSLFTYLELLD